MHTSEVISSLQRRGVTLKVVSGGLKIGGVDKLTDHEKATLRAHKSAILRALEHTPIPTTGQAAPAPVAASTAATRPAVRECRDCSNFERYPYEIVLGSCHALKRMQNAGSKPTRFGCSHFEPKESLS